MRNLALIDSLHVGDAEETVKTKVIAVDYDTKAVYCTSDSGIAIIHPDNQQVTTGIVFREHVPLSTKSCVISSHHLADQMSICVAFSCGNMLLWNLNTDECDNVGCVESGIKTLEWSPDQEVLVIVTGEDSVIIMTRDFDAVTEIPLEQSGFGEAEFVTVGWGKKETQFHGSVGKQAAVVKTEMAKPAFAWDDRKPRISWRGDGQYFVVSFINAENGNRTLRTWTRDGLLHSTSENVDGIEQSLCWKPSGSLIATTQRKPNTHDVVFFERNGLRHGEFSLPFNSDSVQVKELLWNIESTVLLVWCEELSESNTQHMFPKSCLQLWTVSNYHWYLKQNLKFEETPEDCISAVCWDPEHAYMLHVVCQGGRYVQYRWCWKTIASTDVSAQVAVIDGDHVLMTAFENVVVPPPMSAYSICIAKSHVNQVFFFNENIFINRDNNMLYYYTFGNDLKDDGSVATRACGGNGFAVKCKTPKLYSKFKLEMKDRVGFSYPLQCYHFLCISSNEFIFTSLSVTGNSSVIHKYNTTSADQSSESVIDQSVDVDGRVLAMALNSTTGNIVVQLHNGNLYKLATDTWSLVRWEVLAFPQPCPQMALFTLDGEEVVLGLTERFRLYINNLEIATNCTSYAIHDQFLLLTTHAHTCRCISRDTKLSALTSLSDGKAHPFDESVRRVERGSRIVCIVPNETKVVLQMPRGNLETIHPRALVLASIKKHINKLEFDIAFGLMKKHRVNMNLLYDNNPEFFLKNVDTFIKQIDSSTHINLFISELQEEDVTKTMYTATYQKTQTISQSFTTMSETKKRSKVDDVCNALQQALQKADYNKYMLSILTCFVKKTTPELEKALGCVKSLQSGSGDHHSSNRAHEALKYLLFLVDVNELYDVALGTYDFDLVLMVAEKSQKDPKEYLPFLNNLRRLERNYQKFTIDKHLKKYKSALKHIVLTGEEHFEECLQLVKDQRLYPEALQCYSSNTNQYKTVANAYGDYLCEKKYYEEAGIIYLKGINLDKAQEQFEKCLAWGNCLSVYSQLGYEAQKMTQLTRTLALRLKEARKYSEASLVLEQYADDPEEAIVTLIQGHLWEEAVRMMYKHKRADFIESDLRPAIVDCVQQQRSSISEKREIFHSRCQRLMVVRTTKHRQRLELMGEFGNNHADIDLYSDTSSATGDSLHSADSRGGTSRKSGSIYTKVSGTSRKAKRKAEGKKKWSLKEGSKFEDFAIIESLAQMIKHIDSMRSDICSLLKISVQFNYDSIAKELQIDYENLLLFVENAIPEIWDSSQIESNYELPSFGPDSTANTIALAMQQKPSAPTYIQELDPVLKVPPTVTKDNSWKLNVLSKESIKNK